MTGSKISPNPAISAFAETGLDDGPLLPRAILIERRNRRIADYWQSTGASSREVARKFGVSHDTVCRVVRGLRTER